MLLSLRVCETMVRLFHFEFRGQVRGRVTWEPYAWVHCTRTERAIAPLQRRRNPHLIDPCPLRLKRRADGTETAEVMDQELLTASVFDAVPTDDSWTQPLGPTPQLSPSERAALNRLLGEFRDIFSRTNADLGRTNVTQQRIVTTEDVPVHPPYRQPFHLRPEIDRQVAKTLDMGVIPPSSSPWSSAVLLVPKK